MSEYSSTEKKKIIIKKKKNNNSEKQKSNIKKILNNKYNDKNIENEFLEFDYDIEDEFKKTLPSEYIKPDVDKLNNIINSNLSILDKFTDDIEEEIEEDFKEKTKSTPDEFDEFEKHIIGNKVYFIDYNKGIIYDTNNNIIGNIDDYGEINITDN